jgi:hypothetical protein
VFHKCVLCDSVYLTDIHVNLLPVLIYCYIYKLAVANLIRLQTDLSLQCAESEFTLPYPSQINNCVDQSPSSECDSHSVKKFPIILNPKIETVF